MIKRILKIVLICILCLLLCSCGSEGNVDTDMAEENTEAVIVDPKEAQLAEADALIEEGRYDDAIAVLSEIEPYKTYKMISEKIEETQKLKEAAIEAAKPTSHPVAITMENWETYFEQGELTKWKTNEFNEADGFSILYYLKLKDEYRDSVDFDKSDVVVDYTHDDTWYNVDVNFEERSYTLSVRNGDWHYDETSMIEHHTGDSYQYDGVVFDECEDWPYWLRLTSCRFWINASTMEPQIPDYPYSLVLNRFGGNLYLYDKQ